MTAHAMMYSSLEPMHSDSTVLPDQLFLLSCIHDLLPTVYESLLPSLGVKYMYTVINILIVRLVGASVSIIVTVCNHSDGCTIIILLP